MNKEENIVTIGIKPTYPATGFGYIKYNDDNSTVIAVVGVKDLNIINSNNVILIANKDKMGELPNLIEKIKCDKEFKKYL